jgi:maltoporin
MTRLSRAESSPLRREERREAPPATRRSWRRSCIIAGALLLASAPRTASADLPAGRVDIGMYGRMGVAWGLTGPQIIQGQSMSMSGAGIGGRLEEGDYLEPTVKFHVVKPDNKDDTYVDAVLTPAMFSTNGSFLGFFSNGALNLSIQMFQAYVEAGNVFIPGLTFWGGERFYRGGDVHIADYFYFNALNGQGGGVKYKGLDLAVILRSSPSGDPQYNINANPPTAADPDAEPDIITRQRTVLVGQYTYGFGERSSSVQGLAEFHILPPARKDRAPEVAPGDYGWVLGAKLHLDFDKGNFNDLALRVGTRIANGALFGSATYYSYGAPDPVKNNYDGALGVELVDHFLFNIGSIFTINGYGILHYGKGADTATKPEDRGLQATVGARTFVYAHKNFHMINELTVQGRKDGDNPLGTAVKFSIVPTIVPSAQAMAWARPHMRLIYTAAFYNEAAVDQKMSPYLRNVSASRVGHYLGARTEWWF